MSLKMLEREKTSEKNSVSFRTGLIIFLVTVIVILSLILGIIILNHNVNKYKKEAEKAKAEVSTERIKLRTCLHKMDVL